MIKVFYTALTAFSNEPISCQAEIMNAVLELVFINEGSLSRTRRVEIGS